MGTPANSETPVDSSAESFRYDAFISYRHVEPDRRWAKWLHTSLETYRVPKQLVQQRGVASRIKRVFRDEEELPASADLNQEIETALRESRFLIVICSPRVVESEWVNKEVLRFREMGRHDRILALLIEGEPAESFPLALREIRRKITDESGMEREQIEEVEPLAADVRPSRREARGHLQRMAKLRLFACILGCRFDDLRQREQERRTRRLAYISTVATLLLFVMSALAVLAFVQRRAAIVNERTAKLRLAEGLVSEGDALNSSGRVVDARKSYWEAFNQFEALDVPPLRAEAAICAAYGESAPPLISISRQPTYLRSVVISLDGRTALTCDEHLTVTIWDLMSGTEIRTVQGHTSGVETIAISADGGTAVSGSYDQTLKVWDLKTGNEVRTLQGHTSNTPLELEPPPAIAISVDGGTAISGNKTLKVWDLKTGKQIRTLQGHTRGVGTIAISPDRGTAVSGSYDKTLKVWDLKTGKEIRTLQGHAGAVNAIAISPDGGTAVSGSDDKTLKVWDLKTGKEIRTLQGHTGAVNAIAISPDGGTAVSGSDDKTLKVWDVQNGREIGSLHGHEDRVITVAISPDGGTALSGSMDDTLKLWNLWNRKEIRSLNVDAGELSSIAVSPDSRSVLFGSSKKTLKLLDLQTGKEIRFLEGHEDRVTTVAFSPQGQVAISGSYGSVKLWDLQTGKVVRDVKGDKGDMATVAISPDGRSALCGSYSALKLWDLEHDKEIFKFPVGDFGVERLAISPDGRSAVTFGFYRLKVWDMQSGKEILQSIIYDRAKCVAINPDGTAISGGDRLRLWDLRSGAKIGQLQDKNIEVVYSVVINPDGRSALSGSDKTLKLWDLPSRKEIRTLKTSGVTSVAISPDGRIALSGNIDHTLGIWDFARIRRYWEFDRLLPKATEALTADRNDAHALSVLGDWYAFRGKNDWAIKLLEKAWLGGAAVDPLTLARCYWELSGDIPIKSPFTRDACLAGARRKYAAALAVAKDPADVFYLQLCLGAVEREIAAPATQPATMPSTRPTE